MTLQETLLPPWAQTLRDHQSLALDEITDAYRTGARLVILDAPTGAGKSLIGEMAGRMTGWSRLYTCTTRNLQRQFIRDYGADAGGPAELLMGRSNYPTLQGEGWGMPTCADCEGTQCSYCTPKTACPYRAAKQTAYQAESAVINTALALTDWNYGRPENWGPRLVVMDECDELEGELLRTLEVTISARRMRELRLTPPKKTVAEDWAPWVERKAGPAVARWLRDHARDKQGELSKRRGWYAMEELRDRLRGLVPELRAGGWVHCYSRGSDAVTFKPVVVAGYGKDWLWRHFDRWLLMSATVISPEEMVESLGVPEDWDWRVVRVPMTFPAENRLIWPWPVAEMTQAGKEAGEWHRLGMAVAKVLDQHPDERVLVHTVSYELAGWLYEGLTRDYGDRLVTYRQGADASKALSEYLSRGNGVLLAPSMTRGVDLPDDQCRVVVVCKVPYLYLGDQQVSARLHSPGGQTWYTVNAMRELVQATGRAVRHDKDHAVSYILDKTFVKRWNQFKQWLPGWWQEAVRWDMQPWMEL